MIKNGYGKYVRFPDDPIFPDTYVLSDSSSQLTELLEAAKELVDKDGWGYKDALLSLSALNALNGTLVNISEDGPMLVFADGPDNPPNIDKISDLLSWENGCGELLGCIDDTYNIDTHGLTVDLDELAEAAIDSFAWSNVLDISVVYNAETGEVSVMYPGNYSTRLSADDPRICFRTVARSSAQELMDAIYTAMQQEVHKYI